MRIITSWYAWIRIRGGEGGEEEEKEGEEGERTEALGCEHQKGIKISIFIILNVNMNKF